MSMKLTTLNIEIITLIHKLEIRMVKEQVALAISIVQCHKYKLCYWEVAFIKH